MRYWILPASGIPLSRTTVQRSTYLDTCTDSNKSRLKVFYDAIQERFHEKYDEATFASESSSNPKMEIWDELAENDQRLKGGIQKSIQQYRRQ